MRAERETTTMKRNINILPETTINAEGKLHSNHTKSVTVLYPSGKIVTYTSVHDVAEALGTHPGYVSMCLNSETEKKCKGCVVVHAKKATSLFDRVIEINNKNVNEMESLLADANAYRQQQAEAEAARKAEEKRLEEERKENEALIIAIGKARKKLARRHTIRQRKENEAAEALVREEEAQRELDALLRNANATNEEELWTA